MKDQRIISPSNQNDAEISVRPISLQEFVGQNHLKDNLNVFIQASKHRGESLDHILFYGPPGLGKTTLSQIVATEMDSNIKYTSGPSITKQGDLAAIITNLDEKDVLFIDEIHRLPIAVEEILYSAMEDFKIDFMVGEGSSARSLRLDLPHFTLVGATTRYGLISSPLRDRFGITLQLNFYEPQELVKIVMRSASILGLAITEDAGLEIAQRSRGTPGIANRLLRRLRDFLTISDKTIMDMDLANISLKKLGIDAIGLDELDRKYLNSMVQFYNGGPVGIDTLSVMLAESKDTLEDTVEPYLIQKGFVSKTPRGRVMTNFAWEYLNCSPKVDTQNKLDL